VRSIAKDGPGSTSWSGPSSLQGAKLIIAVGGDGTIQEVVNGLMQAGTSLNRRPQLGIINAGTGHGFAQSVGLPASIDDRCAGIALGTVRGIDIGRAMSHFWGKSGQDVDKHIFTGEMIVMELLKWYTSVVAVTGRPFNARASKRPVVPPPLVGRYAERL